MPNQPVDAVNSGEDGPGCRSLTKFTNLLLGYQPTLSFVEISHATGLYDVVNQNEETANNRRQQRSIRKQQ